MLKLVIVDDEVFVRLGLKSTIDWGSIGYEFAGEAEDGQKALEVIRNTHPDVVLTDIFMPRMNGLELIKALKSEMPEIKIVVLSCNKDYEYVREAMQHWGALDYLFKLSVRTDELIGVLKNVKEIIEKEKAKHNAKDYSINPSILKALNMDIPMGTYIFKVVDYVDKNFSLPIKLNDIAENIHISENYLSSLFKKETGLYFTDFLNLYRIAKAKEMLEEGNINVNEVAELVGYSSLSYFSRVFKQLEGENPVDYKKRSHK